jgi:multidrug efflux system membrane fusion protein
VLTSIVSLDPIYVYFDVHEQTMLRIKHLMQDGKVSTRSLTGIPVEIGLADQTDDHFAHKGLIDFTDNRVDYSRGTLEFRAKLENKDLLLNPGLFVRVRLPIGDAHKAVMIRERAIVTDHKEVNGEQVREKGVYLIRERDEKGQPFPNDEDRDGKPFFNDKKPLAQRAFWSKVSNTGVVKDGFVEVESGVREGDRVVVSGMQRLKNDKLVKAVQYSGVTPDSEGKQQPESISLAPKGAHQAARLSE